MSWTMKDGKPFHTVTEAGPSHNKGRISPVNGARMGPAFCGAMREHRRIKRLQAEERNKNTSPERRKVYRLTVAIIGES